LSRLARHPPVYKRPVCSEAATGAALSGEHHFSTPGERRQYGHGIPYLQPEDAAARFPISTRVDATRTYSRFSRHRLRPLTEMSVRLYREFFSTTGDRK